MNAKDLEPILTTLIGEYGWIFIATAAAFLFKNIVQNFISGMLFLWGSDFDVDDIVFIGGTKKARIIRQTMTKTVFYIYETERKLIIPNSALYSLKCEKLLPQNGHDD